MQNLHDQIASEFNGVKLSLASPEHVLEWSHGEVTKPETINYRTQKPEKDGLFCERIFGPTKDWECYCGKYKRIRYKDVVCDKCGVKVTRSIVRRERMGHITLAVPVTHIWFLRGTPSSIGTVLNMTIRDLERVVYFANYIVTEVNDERRKEVLTELEKDYTTRQSDIKKKHAGKDEESLKARESELADLEANYTAARSEIDTLAKLTLLSESKYRDLNLKYGDLFRAGIGAEAVLQLLGEIELDKLIDELRKEEAEAQGQRQRKILKRLKMLEGMKSAEIRPEWMIVSQLPVIPPDLRPMVQLAGGRFAASDLNDLYRRVINRNNRLKRLIELDAPEVIKRNEKRMLQEAVDALIDNNARRERAVSASTGGRRKLRSLSDMLKGKQGRFRQNLLGKRVDYSGRSVIVSGPELKLYQCGLPKMMALELFKPFIIGRLIEGDFAHNVRSASRMIERGRNEVWDTLEDIIKDKYVLLNRAPTLHRLGIQAFQPVLIEGKAIQLHPLVCYAFNADFDGDQMAVHVPLSEAAQKEAREIMLSSSNLLKPASGEPVINPSKDMVLGAYYLTYEKFGEDKPVKYFNSAEEAIYAYDTRAIELQNRILVEVEGERIVTTVGRILFNEILPEGFGFRNESMNKKTLQRLVAEVFVRFGPEATAKAVDDIKQLGFRYATKSGLSISIDDFVTPEEKAKILSDTEQRAVEVSLQYQQGLITDEERYQRTVNLWQEANNHVRESLENRLKAQTNATTVIIDSAAHGDIEQVNQIAGMLGLVSDPSGKVIELPIKSNYKEGFSVLEYFNSTHGARKGLTDTALRTAESGYLTRRLVDVAQDVIVTIEDCGDKQGVTLSRLESESIGETYSYRLSGRVTAGEVKGKKGETLVKKNQLITDELAHAIDDGGVEAVRVKSVLSCRASWGVCRLCYGIDLARGHLVALGEPVGVIAAQSIGEPGTQLTMKTFHKGGVASEDITSGLPRVEEIFEARAPKGQAVLAEVDGVINVAAVTGKHIIRITPPDLKVTEYELEGRKSVVKSGDTVTAKDVLAEGEGQKPLKAKVDGRVEVKKDKILLTHEGENVKEYTVPNFFDLEVKTGDLVKKGQRLTEGSINLQEMLLLLGEAAVQRYIVAEVQSIYSSQGQAIADKHIEIIIRQMFSRVQVDEPGDSLFVTGDVVSKVALEEENRELDGGKKQSATYHQLLLSITKIATSSDSFLSAASFQDTTRVLIAAAIRGKTDKLRGLKENVIIGRLIPVGTGFKGADSESVASKAESRAEAKAQAKAVAKTEANAAARGETEATS